MGKDLSAPHTHTSGGESLYVKLYCISTTSQTVEDNDSLVFCFFSFVPNTAFFPPGTAVQHRGLA